MGIEITEGAFSDPDGSIASTHCDSLPITATSTLIGYLKIDNVGLERDIVVATEALFDCVMDAA